MKVLFAVSNENISESIVKKYQKEYKEIISYKNVYYFNAILKEIQKDKSYDMIVISEDLEPYSNNNYDMIDKFIFERLDSITDEATTNTREDTPIILICTDRRAKSEPLLVKLFGIGVYNAILGQDRSIDTICKLIKVPRTKKEAKLYYKIDADEVNYKTENENDVSEEEIQSIINHYKKLGKNENKFVDSFEQIANQYTDIQLKVIAGFLPLNVRAVLEAGSPKYQQIMTTMGKGNYVPATQAIKEKKADGIKVDFLDTKDKKPNLSKPVVIPSAVNLNNVRKGKKSQNITNVPEEIKQEPVIVEDEFEDIEDININVPEKDIKVEEPKRRGRPRKNPLPDETDELTAKPKRRGRPRKNPLPDETLETVLDEIETIQPVVQRNTNNILPGFDDLEEDDDDDIIDISSSITGNSNAQNNILPGFDDLEEDDDDFIEATISGNTNTNQYQEVNNENINNFNEPKTNDMINQNVDYNANTNIDSLLTKDKKLVSFVGTSKNGTSFLVNNLAELLSSMGINVAILDATTNRNAYYIYTNNEEELRKISSEAIPKLINGIAQGIKVNKNLSVYTSIPDEDVGMDHYEKILSTLVQNHSLVLIDCDFNTNYGYFAESQEIYLVQSMDVLTIQPLTAYLRDLKAKNILKQEKLRIVINKETKVRSLSSKVLIGGISTYSDPAMSFMTELFNREAVTYCNIPFEEQTYARYLEGLVNCKISLKGYSKEFLNSLNELGNLVYPLIGSKQAYKPNTSYESGNFSNNMNNTLDQMKKRY